MLVVVCVLSMQQDYIDKEFERTITTEVVGDIELRDSSQAL